jgi:dTDP-glucose pyrophosphorylase
MTQGPSESMPVKPIAKPWQKALLRVGACIQDAIKSLNDSGLQIAVVVSDDGTLIGTITDGDIRRGLLNGLSLISPVAGITNADPLVVPPQWSREVALQLMRANKIHQLPVIDERRKVVGLHVWDELLTPTPRPNGVIVMAGGQGTRLRPHTETCPKPMLPVMGKPMLEYIVERGRHQGFSRFLFAVHYLSHAIEDHFGDGSHWQVSIEYLREKSPLGTAGALSLMQPRPTLPFVVTNGDLLTHVHYGDLLDFHSRHGATATMGVRLHEWEHPFGVVHTDGVDLVGFDEKPITRSQINAGIYALDPAALDVLSTDEPCDMPQLFSRLRERGSRTIVYPMHEPWLDVGRPDDLEEAQGWQPSGGGTVDRLDS